MKSKSGRHSAKAGKSQTLVQSIGKSIGVGDLSGTFNATSFVGAPRFGTRQISAFSAFNYGWATLNNYDTGVSDALNVGATATDTMYPLTDYAANFNTYAWPIYQDVFSQGIGSRTTITLYELVRYFAMVTELYQILYMVKCWRDVYKTYDWSSCAPGMKSAPVGFLTIAENLGIKDADFEAVWGDLYQRLESHSLPPDMVNDIKRLYAPKMMAEIGPRLMLPSHPDFDDFQSADTAAAIVKVVNYFTYIDSDVKAIKNYLSSFLPFRLSEQNPWETEVIADIFLESAWWNSPVYGLFYGFGYTGDYVPAIDTAIMFDSDSGAVDFRFHSRFPQASWDEVRFTNLYEKINSDAAYQNCGIHSHRKIQFRDYGGTVIAYDGSAGLSEGIAKYLQFTNCRWVLSAEDYDYGLNHPFMTDVVLALETIENMVIAQSRQDFGVNFINERMGLSNGAWMKYPNQNFPTT